MGDGRDEEVAMGELVADHEIHESGGGGIREVPSAVGAGDGGEEDAVIPCIVGAPTCGIREEGEGEVSALREGTGGRGGRVGRLGRVEVVAEEAEDRGLV
jgi:hypothetical protein